jgi:hypothetical protein
MNREDLVSLCELFAGRRGLVHGRVRVEFEGSLADPVPEILRSFRRAEISESEKNALLALVRDPEEEDVLGGETCILEQLADEQTMPGDDD